MVHTRKGPHKEDEDLIITFFKREYFASIIENAIETRTNQLVKKIDTLEEIIQNLIAENLKITTMLEKIHCKDGLDVSYGTDVSDASVVEQETRQNNDSHEKHQNKTPRKKIVQKYSNRTAKTVMHKDRGFQGFKEISRFSRFHHKGGGVGIWAHESLSTSIVAKVIENSISDHNTILCSTKLGSTPKVSHTEVKRSFKAHHVNCFKQDLNNHSWSYLYAQRNLDNAFNDFYGVCLNYFNTHFPLKRHTVRSNTKGWVNDSVKISSSNLKDLFHLKTIFPDIGPSYDEAKKAHVKLIKETKENTTNRKSSVAYLHLNRFSSPRITENEGIVYEEI
nr:unnamed protein product [Callosobruchus analis]